MDEAEVETVDVSLEEAGIDRDPGNDADELPDYDHDSHDVLEAADADPDDPFELARPADASYATGAAGPKGEGAA